MLGPLLIAFALLSSRAQGADAPFRSDSQCIVEKLELLAAQPKAAVVPEASTQLFLGAFNHVGNSAQADAIVLNANGKDLVLRPSPKRQSIQFEIDPDQARVRSIEPLLEPEKMIFAAELSRALHGGRNARFLAPPGTEKVLEDNFGIFSDVQQKVIIENMNDFLSFQFVAKSDGPGPSKIFLETDTSRNLSERLGKKVVYEAQFQSQPEFGYVNIPFSSFKPVIEGKIRNDLPGIAAQGDGPKHLNLRSIGFEVADGTDLTIHDRQIGVGFSFGADFNTAKRLLSRMAELHDENAEKATESSKIAWEKGRASQIRTVVKMMDRMPPKLKSFPELDALKDTPENQQISYLKKHLGEMLKVEGNRTYTFEIGPVLGDEKITIPDFWQFIAILKTLPVESGNFAELHSKYAHVYQMAAMLKGSTVEEQKALESLLAPRPEFPFNWNLIFDATGGGANDPAAWKKYEIHK